MSCITFIILVKEYFHWCISIQRTKEIHSLVYFIINGTKEIVGNMLQDIYKFGKISLIIPWEAFLDWCRKCTVHTVITLDCHTSRNSLVMYCKSLGTKYTIFTQWDGSKWRPLQKAQRFIIVSRFILALLNLAEEVRKILFLTQASLLGRYFLDRVLWSEG